MRRVARSVMVASLLLVQVHDVVPHHHHSDGTRAPGSVVTHLDHHVADAPGESGCLEAGHPEIVPHSEAGLEDGRPTPVPHWPAMALPEAPACVAGPAAASVAAPAASGRMQPPSTGPPAVHASRAPPALRAA